MFSLIQKFDYPSTSLMNEATPSAMKKVALYDGCPLLRGHLSSILLS